MSVGAITCEDVPLLIESDSWARQPLPPMVLEGLLIRFVEEKVEDPERELRWMIERHERRRFTWHFTYRSN